MFKKLLYYLGFKDQLISPTKVAQFKEKERVGHQNTDYIKNLETQIELMRIEVEDLSSKIKNIQENLNYQIKNFNESTLAWKQSIDQKATEIQALFGRGKLYVEMEFAEKIDELRKDVNSILAKMLYI